MTHVTRLTGLVAALAFAVAGAAPAGARATYGHTGAPDGRLRAACHDYRYSYVVDTPSDDWALETFLLGPRGKKIASGVFLSDSDPARGMPSFRFCGSTTHPGRFTIRAKISWYDAYNEEHQGRLAPTRFRLVR